MDRILMQVIFSLAKAGYPQYIEDIKKRIRFERELIPGRCLVTRAVFCYSGWRGKRLIFGFVFPTITMLPKLSDFVLFSWMLKENYFCC